ncbi:MAG TPA: hypothetical protein VN605_00085 [Thermoanaerobaculia bacterium]|nr:hypothetical protein [Thermoanaerobaculia bacterium]
MTEVITAPASASAPSDRSAGLIFFGVLQLGVGAICAMIALAVAAAMSTTPPVAGAMPSNVALAPTLVVYGVAAFYFASVGIGSIRRRRWACALSAAVGALWLVFGVVSAIVVFLAIPKLLVMVPRSQEKAFVGGMTGFVLFFLIALPLAIFLFYKSDRTRETCELRDARIRWTDRVTLPVLALAILLGFTSISLLMSLTNPVLPLMGTILTGGPAAIAMLALSGLCAFLMVQLYRLKESAWWTLVLLQLIGGIVAAITMARIDIDEVYRRAGLLTPQVQAMHLEELYRNPILWVLMAAAWLATFAFLLSIRKDFVGSGPRTRRGEV